MSVFNESSQTSLEKTFQSMINPKLVEEKVEDPAIIPSEEKKDEAPKPESIQESDDSKVVGSKFNEIYQSCFGNPTLVSEMDELSLDVGSEGGEYSDETSIEGEFDDEGEMISVPASAIRELYAYLEDSMGSEDVTDVENLDIELEEGNNDGTPSQLSNKLGDLTQNGKKVVSDKLGTRGIGKTGDGGGNSKDKSGTPKKLMSILSHYLAKGSARQSHLAVGDQPAK